MQKVEDGLPGEPRLREIARDIDGVDPAAARARVEDMCKKLLANTVVENYRVDLAS